MCARVVLTLAVAACPALTLAQVPAGSEFQINTYTTGNQTSLDGSMDAHGNLIFTWVGSTPGAFNVWARRFDAAGDGLGDQFRVYPVTETVHPTPSVAATARGDFVVAWPASAGNWLAQRFSPDGGPLGEPLSGTSISKAPTVAARPHGDFVIVWEQGPVSDANILAQRFDRWGVRVGAEFQVNTYTTGQQTGPAVAFDSQGGFVVVWGSEGQDGSYSGVFGQRFGAAGARLGAEFRVNTYTTLVQRDADVATSADGRFVVVWAGSAQDSFPGSRVFGQRFDPSGVPTGPEFRVGFNPALLHLDPEVATDAAGNFIVAWTAGSPLLFDAFLQRFTAAGARRGGEFVVHDYVTASQGVAALISDEEGNFVVAWSGAHQGGPDSELFGKRFGALRSAALAADTAGNRVFEPGESVDVRPSWRNITGAAQAFSGSASSFTGPLPATYEIVDGVADYGTVSGGATAQCGDCYRVSVPATIRPSMHWDGVLEESITPDAHGQDKLWRLHLGGSFADVPASSPYYPFIETLLHRGVTTGCTGPTYCPTASSTREQMAVFVLVAKEGAGYAPPACGTPVFDDVPGASPFCRWIEELARRGVVSGCAPGRYCPGDAVTREQMAVFVLRTLNPNLDPPACTTTVFADVPASSPFCRWIEELVRRGVVSGCGAGLYCPAAPVSREQMGVFLGVTFGLTLYGP